MCSPGADSTPSAEEWSIEAKSGDLVIRPRYSFNQTYRLPVYSGMYTIDIGCHRLTPEAWKLLKEKVDGKSS